MAAASIRVPLPAVELPGGHYMAEQEIEAPPLASRRVIEEVETSPGAERFLSFRFVSDLGATAAGACLIEGTDYLFDKVRGILQSKGPRRIKAAYVGHQQRYDLVVYDPALGAYRLLAGAHRPLDPEEYRPRAPAGCIAAFSVFQWSGGSEVIALYPWAGPMKRGAENQFRDWLEHCRERLPTTMSKLRRREPILIGGYGDSTTAIGNRELMQNLHPNGSERDRVGFFDRMPPDTRARYCQSPDDAGRTRIEVGWNWRLRRQFERRGCAAEYLNWGVAGTTTESGSSAKENGVYLHGSNPQRLAAAAASRCDMMVVGFGANEIGAAGVGERLETILRTFVEAGAECLVLTPTPENPAFIDRPLRWERTQQDVINAALRCGCAYAPLNVLFGAGSEGATGLSPMSYAAGNLSNHPGVAEFDAISDYLSLIFEEA